MRQREALADQRIVRSAGVLGQLNQAAEFGPERQRHRRCPIATLEAQQRIRHRPAVVHPADHQISSGARVGEEHFVEVVTPIDVDNGPHLNAGLIHRHK